MAYQPQFHISPRLLERVEQVALLRERIRGASVELSWVPALQKDSRSRNVHASTAIEGNPLTLEEVRALEPGGSPPSSKSRAEHEVLNYFAGLRYIEKHSRKRIIRHEDVFALHRLLAQGVMDQGQAGRYRTIGVRVGGFVPPPPREVSGLMFELLEWWSKDSINLSPVLSSAIVHYRFEAIHPFADGNGRTGRALALWDLYRRGFDTHHVFSVDEFYWEDRPRYYAALEAVRKHGEDLSEWLEYCAEGLQQTLERVWKRIQSFQTARTPKLVLRPRQEQLLQLLSERGEMAPSEIWKAFDISRQGALDLLRPLLDAGLVERTGSRRYGRYVLKKPPPGSFSGT